MRYTLEQLVERCAYWQGVLRLQDLDVTVRILRQHEMHTTTSVGQVWCASGSRQAHISLLDPHDFKPSESARTLDMEDTLVHELLHLHFHDLHIEKSDDKPQTAEAIAEERAIDVLTAALVRLDRRAA